MRIYHCLFWYVQTWEEMHGKQEWSRSRETRHHCIDPHVTTRILRSDSRYALARSVYTTCLPSRPGPRPDPDKTKKKEVAVR
jgi:hypothetical protein